MAKIEKGRRRPWQPERVVQGRRSSTNRKFYQGSAWRNLRNYFIERNPLCVECHKHSRLTPGDVVDHIKPINQGGKPLSVENLQTLCHPCHNRKSASEAHSK